MVASIIIGLAVPSILLLVGSSTMQNNYSQKFATANMLASQVREMMSTMAFTDVLALNGQTNNPPIDANHDPITGMDNWQQGITVTLVGDGQGASLDTITGNPLAIVARVRVTMSYRKSASDPWSPIVTTSWLKTRY